MIFYIMGIIYNNVKYLKIINDNNLKKKSLEDNLYFTLSNIILNIENVRMTMEIHVFMDILTNGICLENRKNNFRYSKILLNKTFVFQLYCWFTSLLRSDFTFETVYDNVSNLDNYNYILFDKWMEQLDELIEGLDDLYYDL